MKCVICNKGPLSIVSWNREDASRYDGYGASLWHKETES